MYKQGRECTFKPKLISKFDMWGTEITMPIHERARLWKEQKEAKLAEYREREKDKDLAECTFKPNIVRKENC